LGRRNYGKMGKSEQNFGTIFGVAGLFLSVYQNRTGLVSKTGQRRGL
jgi:hypothetical protein